jgi:FkbM family methyltransferase
MKIYYGLHNLIDVTSICMTQLMNNNIITIPYGDGNRSKYFTDPLPGIHKKIVIEHNGISYYDEYIKIVINIETNVITKTNQEIQSILVDKQSTLSINHGNFNEELPEQKMAVRYLTGNEKVLEIGGNIGRNSLIIASMLNHTDFVSLESNPIIAKQLIENRDLNHLQFHIENSALSTRKLIQKHWDTKPSNVLEPGYNWVKTITLQQLNEKYNIVFDTLILDCEGAFYYILMDMPEILTNIKLIIMENDYWDISHKKYIDNVLQKNKFNVEYSEQGGWGPCSYNFFEVWKR